MTFPEKIKAYIAGEKLLDDGDRVLVGVSGGADSLCLLLILEDISREKEIPITAAHINHGIRGEEADADEAFVKDFCAERGIPFAAVRADIPGEAASRRLTEEEAGRVVRMEIFRDLMAEKGLTKLALAHHKNDLAETMLYNMARGSGLAGLASLRSRRDNVIRPLLCVDRGEIEAYLAERQIAFRTDHTNDEDDHTRNRIRHHVLPYLTEEVNDRTLDHMAALAATAAETVDFIRSEAAARLEPHLKSLGDGCCVAAAFFKGEPVIVKTGTMLLLEKLNGPRRDVGRIHLDAVIDLGRGPCGRHLDLPGFEADKTREGVILRRVDKEDVRRKLGR